MDNGLTQRTKLRSTECAEGQEWAGAPFSMAPKVDLMSRMLTLLSQICLLTFLAPPQDLGTPSGIAKGGGPDESAGETSWAADFAGDLLADLLSALPWDWEGGLAIDGTLGWSDRGGRDRTRARLRSAELVLNGFIGDALETHLSLHANSDHVELEHLTLGYTDLPGDGSLHFGRMPIRFGRQMHQHVHELSSASRPRLLGEYLGTTLSTTGVHYDSFLIDDQAKSLRMFAGAFGSMHSEHEGRGHDHSTGGQKLEAVGLSARLVGAGIPVASGNLQLGASWRTIPDYTLTVSGAGSATGLSNRIMGLDAEYSPTDAGWTLGLEFVEMSGDLGSDDDGDSGMLDLVSGNRSGWLLSYGRPLTERTSLGLILSEFEHLDAEGDSETEAGAAWSWQAADFLRVRLAATQQVSDSENDLTRVMIQFTGVIGQHNHDHGHDHGH